MKVNGQTIEGDKFAYDGCHKIYVLADDNDLREAIEEGYESNILPIELLPDIWERSCELRFIRRWDVSQPPYVCQCEEATFEL